jgi:hypothetical protein
MPAVSSRLPADASRSDPLLRQVAGEPRPGEHSGHGRPGLLPQEFPAGPLPLQPEGGRPEQVTQDGTVGRVCRLRADDSGHGPADPPGHVQRSPAACHVPCRKVVGRVARRVGGIQGGTARGQHRLPAQLPVRPALRGLDRAPAPLAHEPVPQQPTRGGRVQPQLPVAALSPQELQHVLRVGRFQPSTFLHARPPHGARPLSS